MSQKVEKYYLGLGDGAVWETDRPKEFWDEWVRRQEFDGGFKVTLRAGEFSVILTARGALPNGDVWEEEKRVSNREWYLSERVRWTEAKLRRRYEKIVRALR